MSDSELQNLRRKVSTPYEKFHLLINGLRAGIVPGLVYVKTDEEANAALGSGQRVTMKLEIGDVCLVETPGDSPKVVNDGGPFLSVVTSTLSLTLIDSFDVGIQNYLNRVIDHRWRFRILMRGGFLIG